MSVFHLLDADGKPCEVRMEDILTVRPTSRGPEFHTRDAIYYYPTTLEEFLLLLSGHGFERLDRTNLVNMHHVKWFDPKARKVYFDEVVQPDSKFATVSEANVRKVAHLARERKENYKVRPRSLLGLKGEY